MADLKQFAEQEWFFHKWPQAKFLGLNVSEILLWVSM